MPDFDTPDEVTEFTRESRAAAEPVRNALARNRAIASCYYIGRQWISRTLTRRGEDAVREAASGAGIRSPHEFNVTVNRVTKYITLAAAATHPRALFVDVLPEDHETDLSAQRRSRLEERGLNMMIESSRLAECAQLANVRRSLFGDRVLGLHMGGNRITPFEGPADYLTIDPGNSARSMEDHEYVIYSDVQTADAIQAAYGVDLRRDTLRTVGELTPVEQQFAAWSNNLLYQNFRHYSKTKGAIVHHLHVRDIRGVFNRMYVVIEAAGDDIRCVNFDSPETPFGGNGLGLGVLHGLPQPEGPWSVSDFDMMKYEQDSLNTFRTFAMRMMRSSSLLTYLVDAKSMGRDATDEQIARRITNRVGGVIKYDSGPKGDWRPPQVMTMPAIPQEMPILEDRSENSMRSQVFRGGIHEGQLQPRVPASSLHRGVDELERPMSQRAEGDIAVYKHLSTVMLGTIIRHIQQPRMDVASTTLGTLGRGGFQAEDFAVLVDLDPAFPAGKVKVRDSSVRYKSQREKRLELDAAVDRGVITAESYRRVLAVEHDTPLSDRDRQIGEWAERTALNIMAGQPFEPWSSMSPDEISSLIDAINAVMRSRDVPEESRALLNETGGMLRAMLMPPEPESPAATAEPEPQPMAELGAVLSGQV